MRAKRQKRNRRRMHRVGRRDDGRARAVYRSRRLKPVIRGVGRCLFWIAGSGGCSASTPLTQRLSVRFSICKSGSVLFARDHRTHTRSWQQQQQRRRRRQQRRQQHNRQIAAALRRLPHILFHRSNEQDHGQAAFVELHGVGSQSLALEVADEPLTRIRTTCRRRRRRAAAVPPVNPLHVRRLRV
jgi:hypothetical protein